MPNVLVNGGPARWLKTGGRWRPVRSTYSWASFHCLDPSVKITFGLFSRLNDTIVCEVRTARDVNVTAKIRRQVDGAVFDDCDTLFAEGMLARDEN